MAFVAGDIQSIAFGGVNGVGATSFSVASGCDCSISLGGFKPTTRRMGDGSTVVTGERVDWAMRGVDLAIDPASNQLSYLQSVANELELMPVTIELIDGSTDRFIRVKELLSTTFLTARPRERRP